LKNSIAIIPARGGSKSIPKKNIARVGKLSLIERAVILALKSGISEIYVSTDSVEIGSIAVKAGAKVIFRPIELSSDTSSTESAVFHALSQIKYDRETSIALLQATSPFTKWQDLNKAIQITCSGISFFSAINFHSFLWESLNNKWIPINHRKDFRIMKQLMNPTVVETGNFYCFNVIDFYEEGNRFCKESKPFLIDPLTFFQIDSVEDLKVANRLVTLLN
jgi:N-acylneuraminate cytidylyltransferase